MKAAAGSGVKKAVSSSSSCISKIRTIFASVCSRGGQASPKALKSWVQARLRLQWYRRNSSRESLHNNFLCGQINSIFQLSPRPQAGRSTAPKWASLATLAPCVPCPAGSPGCRRSCLARPRAIHGAYFRLCRSSREARGAAAAMQSWRCPAQSCPRWARPESAATADRR